jgi:hypothetical protein
MLAYALESSNFQAICKALFDALGFSLDLSLPKFHFSSITFVIQLTKYYY